jgi:hypothetical protein
MTEPAPQARVFLFRRGHSRAPGQTGISMTNILLKHAPAILVLVAALFFAVQAISGLASALTAARP